VVKFFIWTNYFSEKETDLFFHKYSSVSSVIERTKRWIIKDRKIRTKVKKLVFLLSKSQEQTPCPGLTFTFYEQSPAKKNA
jgi:hypothetical protein